MTNFTINSLSTTNTSSTDNFMKSDSNGVLTKTPAQTLANDLISLAGLKVLYFSKTMPIGERKYTVNFYKLGKILIISLNDDIKVTGASTSGWQSMGEFPVELGSSDIGRVGIILPENKTLMLRRFNNNLEYRSLNDNFYAQGTGVAMLV